MSVRTEIRAGLPVKIKATFTDENDNKKDPSDVYFSIEKHDSGDQTDYKYGRDSEVTQDATGVFIFQKAYDLTETGIYYYRVEGSGSLEAAEEGEFEILDSKFDEPS